ncbi:Rpn family recombination-promoting nuclease/putative transposase [Cystobacter fuscus]|uniref:Rpn family recombination-promoting nuclease/putative transposase n=1 Tax=Cystobacter fuscus TaxID=43 RepID=UPI0037BEC7CC
MPIILPLVMYHGPEGAWSAPRRVEDLFELPGESEEERAYWRAWLPRFEYLLDNLTVEREEALKARRALHWSGWRGWCCATGGRGNWRTSCRSGWAGARQEEGLARGRAESLLRILAVRGIHVEDGARQRILGCSDVDTLDSWFDRVLQATTLSEVLDGGAPASGRTDS